MRDLKSHRWMWIKAALFLVIGWVSCALIVAENPSLHLIALLVLAIWAFCRAYYFAFYVIEKYIDPSYRFSGIFSALRNLWGSRRTPGEGTKTSIRRLSRNLWGSRRTSGEGDEPKPRG